MDSLPQNEKLKPRMRLPQQAEGLAGEGTALMWFTIGLNVFCPTFVELLMRMSGPETPTGWPAYFCFGIIASQPLVIGVIIGLLPQNLLFRLSLAAAFAVTLPLMLIWGGTIFDANNLNRVRELLPAVPLICLSASIPLLLLKNLSRKRLISNCENQFQNPPTSIGGFIVFTTIAAVCTVFVQRMGPDKVKIGGGIACLYFGLSCLIVIPMLLSILPSGRYFRTWTLWCVVAFGLGGLAVYLLSGLLLGFPWQLSDLVMTIGWSISATALTIGIGLPLIVIRLSQFEYRIPDQPPACENTVKQL